MCNGGHCSPEGLAAAATTRDGSGVRSDVRKRLVESIVPGAQAFARAVNTLSKPDAVNHPNHYTSHPSGVECITVTEHMGFNLGNAVKYVWRADLKNDAIEDLRKAAWYIQREISLREKAAAEAVSISKGHSDTEAAE